MKLIKTKYSIVIVAVLILSISVSALLTRKARPIQQQGFAFVELFTSEGCSSCPSAEEAVAEIDKKYNENVYILAFHVDYWNHLGWKDEFSKSAYSDRQKHYSSLFGLNSIYTPQVIVNGKSEFVGSNRSVLQSTITRELKNTANNDLNITARSEDNKRVVVNYKLSAAGNFLLNIALVQLHAVTSVKRGENEGLTLNHLNVVRELQSVVLSKQQDGSVNIILPSGLSKGDCKIIGFLQDKSNWHITSAREISIL